jgi:phage gpG-like protein
MSKFNFDRVLQNFNKVEKELPKELASDTQKFFNNSFRQQGWDGKTWQTPQRRISGTTAYKYPKKKDLGRRTRATLVKSGALRRAVATSLRVATFNKIRFEVDLPYAKVHNDGLPVRNFKMPQRKFMGDSPTLRNLQLKKIKKVIDTIWRA